MITSAHLARKNEFLKANFYALLSAAGRHGVRAGEAASVCPNLAQGEVQIVAEKIQNRTDSLRSGSLLARKYCHVPSTASSSESLLEMTPKQDHLPGIGIGSPCS